MLHHKFYVRKMKKERTDQLVCLLCQGLVSLNFVEGEEDRFLVHMKAQHDAYFNLEFLKAACKMDKDEMTAVMDVMRVKDQQSALAIASQNNTQRTSILNAITVCIFSNIRKLNMFHILGRNLEI